MQCGGASFSKFLGSPSSVPHRSLDVGVRLKSMMGTCFHESGSQFGCVGDGWDPLSLSPERGPVIMRVGSLEVGVVGP